MVSGWNGFFPCTLRLCRVSRWYAKARSDGPSCTIFVEKRASSPRLKIASSRESQKDSLEPCRLSKSPKNRLSRQGLRSHRCSLSDRKSKRLNYSHQLISYA